MAIRARLFDLDGVIRRWDSGNDRRVEVATGLPRGVIAAIAFAARLPQPASIGQVTDEQWRAGIAAELQRRFPHVSGADIVQQWSASADTLANQAGTNLDTSTTEQQYQQAEQLWINNVAWIVLYQPNDSYVVRSSVTGYQEGQCGFPSIRTLLTFQIASRG